MAVLDSPCIRDELKIDHKTQDFYDKFVGAGPVFLFGRIVRHETGLRVGQKPLVIIADEYDGNGHMIDASGAWPSGNGGTVTVRCKRSVNVHISVSGASGAPGAAGADGSEGVPDTVIEGQWIEVPDPWPMETSHMEWVPGETIPGVPGSPPGMGGDGGPGGNAGRLVFTSISQEGWLQLDAEGGGGGMGGPGGFLGAEQGASGNDGASGSASSVESTVVSEDDFHALVRNDIGIYANYWAPYRIVVGNHFYHMYNASIPARAHYLRLAAGEFEAALRFQPDNAEALRLYGQLVGFAETAPGTDEVVWRGGGNNALGLPPKLDLLPRFDYYIDAYESLSSMVLGFLNMGMPWLAGAEGIEAMRRFAAEQLAAVTTALENTRDEVGIAKTEQTIAGKERDTVQGRLDQLVGEIRTALPVMESKSFSFGGLIGTVASIGAAVVAVAAAIPTAGASVIAVVPSMIALADSVSNNGEDIVKSLLKGNKPDDLDKLKKEYEKVGKDVSAVVKGAKSVVNFVEVIRNIGAAATPDNKTYVALVKKGAELAHEVMLAESRVSLAAQRVAAVESRMSRNEALVVSARQLVDDLAAQRHTVRQVGLAAIEIAYSKAIALQTMAFRAQRSLEIYTLQNHEQNVLLDAGMISPDLSRAYAEGAASDTEMATALMTSWGNIFNPINMKMAYIAFFTGRKDWDTYRLSFTGDAELEAMKTGHSLSFRIEADDLWHAHFETKIKNVIVALVGARNQGSEISCALRHGARYEQRLKGGGVDIQELEARVVGRRAETVAIDRPVVSFDPPLDAPTSLAIWGRGVGGDWELSIAPQEIASGHLDLSGLTEIQVWIDYQYTS